MEFPSRQILTVSELTHEIKTLLEANLYYVWVEGEVSNLRSPISGHIYLTLKDDGAQIKAVIFKGQARFMKFKPADGLHVICRGMVNVYKERGEYQIILDYIEPKGLGALQLALEQLKGKLAREGFFEAMRKRPLPPFPKKIGIVTSPTGAAVRDILKVFERRFADIGVLIYPVKVQGIESAREVSEGIKELNMVPGIDVIIIARGGGSQEDLWAFNEEIVARAIFNSKIPVVSAVGHEIDFTIADMVADLRASTPSAAAEMIIRSKEELKERLAAVLFQLISGLRNIIADKRIFLHRLERGLVDPSRRLKEIRLRLGDVTDRLALAMSNSLEMIKKDCRHIAERLNILSPLNILGRGYSITRNIPSMAVLRDSKDVEAGDDVNIILSKGEIFCKVYGRDKV
ncbi:MAG: exodeoxyribonuclease VII large subunit [Deltaproteobacteria bacterium]|nr:exodeoxyribonuclease VII large subunit [Deltaproteobacteria bacterium]